MRNVMDADFYKWRVVAKISHTSYEYLYRMCKTLRSFGASPLAACYWQVTVAEEGWILSFRDMATSRLAMSHWITPHPYAFRKH